MWNKVANVDLRIHLETASIDGKVSTVYVTVFLGNEQIWECFTVLLFQYN